ncbi:MAG: hypothetical protein A2104_09740 [Candidatus Melainabacteria bacterium GWF2_32_7]|nr:MAG: hypothetical protein A2104_09740 [Candidatus Melainabacteria bacterium GWF2_32_7]
MRLLGLIGRKSCKGFSLAEIILVIIILGVVACESIPVILNGYTKQTWTVAYKDTFSFVSQATKLLKLNNGDTLAGLWSNDQGMYQAYLPYFKVAKYCNNQNPYGSCFGSSYNCLDGTMPFADIATLYSIMLTNGVSLGFDIDGNGVGITAMYIDINGKKGPNVEGKDFHWLSISSTAADPVKPWNSTQAEAVITQNCPSTLNSDSGNTCGVRILRGDYGEDY